MARWGLADGFYPTGVRVNDNKFNPNAALVKAVLLNGTRPILLSGWPNNTYGWGRIWLDNNLFFDGDTRRLRVWDIANIDGLQTSQSRSYTVTVAAGQEFRATLAWMDAEASPGSGIKLVNDLNLTVSDGTTTYLGNVFNTSGISIAGGAADDRNTVEQGRFTAPTTGTYTITVTAYNVPGNGRPYSNRQGYALVVSYATVTTAVSDPPADLTLTSNSTMGVDLAWTSAAGSLVTQIYRAAGTCLSAATGDFQYVGSSAGTASTDSRAQGGRSYAYKLRGADSSGEGPLSTCAGITPTGWCDLIPDFGGLASVSTDGVLCRVTLAWSAGTSRCPLGNTMRYNVYRSNTPNFTPSSDNLLTTVTAATTYNDDAVTNGVTYYYIVRAEDGTTGGPGPNGGNLEPNTIQFYGTPRGALADFGTWSDDGGDTAALLAVQSPWRITATDAHDGTRSYHCAPDEATYPSLACANVATPQLVLGEAPVLTYWARYNLENGWDGVVVEISTDAGMSWLDLPPDGGYPGTFFQTGTTPINACAYASTHGAFTGPPTQTLTPWTQYTADLATYAGLTIQIRWRLSSDPRTAYQGLFLDQISVTNAQLSGKCTAP